MNKLQLHLTVLIQETYLLTYTAGSTALHWIINWCQITMLIKVDEQYNQTCNITESNATNGTGQD